jgi:hypothetical protein
MQTKICSFDGEFSFLSNFFESSIRVDGEKYPTVEHAYQASKTFDPWQRRLIREAPTPGKAKRLGKTVKKRDDWDDIRIGVMESLLRDKFSSPFLAQMLIATDDATLIEGNTWGDTFWGVCGGTGENMLGKLLMQIRSDLIVDQASNDE